MNTVSVVEWGSYTRALNENDHGLNYSFPPLKTYRSANHDKEVVKLRNCFKPYFRSTCSYKIKKNIQTYLKTAFCNIRDMSIATSHYIV